MRQLDSVRDALRYLFPPELGGNSSEPPESDKLAMASNGDWLEPDHDHAAHARRLVAGRRARNEFLPDDLLGEPVWDMLLDLFIASHESKEISVSSVCIASGAPATTALRWLSRMEELGLIERTNDRNDRRRVCVAITPQAKSGMERWLAWFASTQADRSPA